MDKGLINMKILITTEQYYPFVSGVSSVVTAIAEELALKKNDIHVATSFLNREKLEINNVKIKEFKIKGSFSTFYRGETKEYLNYVLNGGFDVVINECVQTWNVDLLLPHLKYLKAKKILHSHGFSLYKFKTKNFLATSKAKLYYTFLHKYLGNYDKIYTLSNSNSDVEYLNKYNLNYDILPNGLSSDLISTEHKNNNNNFLINISNYYPLKNQEFILRSFYKSNTNLKLIFIGANTLKNYLEQLRELKKQLDDEFGYKEVTFLYKISRDKTIEMLKQSSLFLCGSKLEAFPIVILESMGTATPFISTDVGNITELKGGMISKDEEHMGKLIDLILDDDTVYNKLSIDGLLEINQKYNWITIVNKLQNDILKLKGKNE